MTNLYGAFISSFLIAFLSIPSIIKIARIKHLYDEPEGRKSHEEATPTLGGIAIFAGFILSVS